MGLIIAGITCFVWKSAMKSAIEARDANKYIPMDGFELTGEEDRFLREEVTRRKIEKKKISGQLYYGEVALHLYEKCLLAIA